MESRLMTWRIRFAWRKEGYKREIKNRRAVNNSRTRMKDLKNTKLISTGKKNSESSKEFDWSTFHRSRLENHSLIRHSILVSDQALVPRVSRFLFIFYSRACKHFFGFSISLSFRSSYRLLLYKFVPKGLWRQVSIQRSKGTRKRKSLVTAGKTWLVRIRLVSKDRISCSNRILNLQREQR